MIREKLQITTPSDLEIAMTRVFDAPRQLVFQAWTTPELLKRWYGVFSEWSMVVCEIDLKVGGSYRYAWRNAGGRQFGQHGVYQEIAAPDRIVFTEHMDDNPGSLLNTLTLVERAGQTTLTITSLCPSKEVRDMVLKSGMEVGIAAGFETLDQIFASRTLG